MMNDKDDVVLISIQTDLTHGWFFTYLHMHAELPKLKVDKVIRLSGRYSKRRKQLLDAYIYAHDNDTSLRLRNAREWADYIENQYMMYQEDGEYSL